MSGRIRATYVIAGLVWAWALILIAARKHLVVEYRALMQMPPGWEWFAASPWAWCVAGGGAIAFVLACPPVADRDPRSAATATWWLSASLAVPLLDWIRVLGGPAVTRQLPPTLWEPLYLALVTGTAAGYLAYGWLPRQSTETASQGRFPGILAGPVGVVAATVSTIGWMTWQGCRYYHGFLLGFNDFGQFALRIDNTWQGRGFLLETPSLPPFWDHFNPGLLLLIPVWAAWPDPRLWIVVQACCLAGPAILVYGIARQLAATPAGASLWSLAYLGLPLVQQLNLNFTYGWHPVSVALPLLFGAVWCVLGGRRAGAATLLLLACSFKEDVVVVAATTTATLAVATFWAAHRKSGDGHVPRPALLVGGRFSSVTWAAISIGLIVVFVVSYAASGYGQYQTSRFGHLGSSPTAIVLSPLLRPAVFWSQILQPRSFVFVLALALPLGAASLWRGRIWWLALVPPLAVLLAWNHQPATSIAFQYPTTFLVVLTLAALTGAAAWGTRSLTVHGWVAVVSAWTLSMALGAAPWSSETLTDVVQGTYVAQESANAAASNATLPRAPGSPDNEWLRSQLKSIRVASARILATGRIAPHLLGIERLETVGQAVLRWEALSQEAGRDRSPLELFDTIILDRRERFQQTADQIQQVEREARRLGFRVSAEQFDIVILVR